MTDDVLIVLYSKEGFDQKMFVWVFVVAVGTNGSRTGSGHHPFCILTREENKAKNLPNGLCENYFLTMTI